MTHIDHFPRPDAAIKVDIRELTVRDDDPQRYVLEIEFDCTTFTKDWRMNSDRLTVKYYVSKEQIQTVLFQLQSAISYEFDPQSRIINADCSTHPDALCSCKVQA